MTKPKILVVADQFGARKLLKIMLECPQEYEVYVVQNGREALDFLETVTPDLLITDEDMPEMSGCELIQHVRDIPQLRDIPIMLLLPKDMEQSVSDLDIQLIVPTPIGLFDFVGAVRKLLEQNSE